MTDVREVTSRSARRPQNSHAWVGEEDWVDMGWFFLGLLASLALLLWLAGRGRRRESLCHAHPRSSRDHHFEELRIDAGISPEDLVARIEALGALRAKGYVETSEGLRVVQGVGPRVELAPVETSAPAALVGRVVAIRRA